MVGARMKPAAVMAIGWMLIYLALASVIGIELDWGRRLSSSQLMPRRAVSVRVDYPVQPEFALLSLEQGFVETTARPVFIPARRPPPPPAPLAPPKPAMQKGQFVLLGALITKDKSIALLRDVATGKATRVEQGKEIKGITVANIYPEKVVLTQYDDSEELVLKIQSQPKPAVPAPPAAGAQPKSVPSDATGGEEPQSLINRRRATRGLPPI